MSTTPKLVFQLLPMIACCGNISNITDGKVVSVGTIHFSFPSVNTTAGLIRGYYHPEASDVSVFLGIPFAEPPVGELRWKKPKSKASWKEMYNATEFGKVCVQQARKSRGYNSSTMSEDCLYLNVYTPGSMNRSKAVMFWVHGGGWRSGSASEYDPSQLAHRGDVVVVTTNYRVNIFGSFDSDGDDIMENFALWDIKLALIWVRDNIDAFGGDKSRVTIFGGSAGAMAVTFMASSPEFTGLFHRLISESGTHLCPKLIDMKPKLTQKSILRRAGCSNMSCLIQMEASEVNKLSRQEETALNYTFDPVYVFAPSHGDELIPHDPFKTFGFLRAKNETVLKSVLQTFSQYDYMGGFSSTEGSLILSRLEKHAKKHDYDLKQGITQDIVNVFMDDYLPLFFPLGHRTIEKKIQDMYNFNEVGVSITSAQELLALFSDMLFAAPTITLLDAHAHSNSTRSTYLYTFTEEVDKYKDSRPDWFHGAPHTEEREFVFGSKLSYYPEGNLTKEEEKLKSDMITAWSNFAKTGNPNSDVSGSWKQYSAQRKFYKEFGASQMDLSGNLARLPGIQSLKDSAEPTTTSSTAATTTAATTTAATTTKKSTPAAITQKPQPVQGRTTPNNAKLRLSSVSMVMACIAVVYFLSN